MIAGFLGDLGVAGGGHAGQQRLAVGLPVHRLVRHAQMLEDLFVEAVVAVEQGLHLAQERARFRALNDAVVVGAVEGHHLADAEHGADLVGGAAVFGRIVDRAGGNDCALSEHQPRIGGHGPDRARIGQRNCGALEIGGREFARRGRERPDRRKRSRTPAKFERAGVLDIRHHQAARAVLAGDVYRHARDSLADGPTR